MSRISVIISTYRRDESLKTAVASVRAQTYPDVEILIADDNADPAWNGKVARVAAEYGARHIVNEQNLGSARNRNHAASLATGEYLAFLDDDDRTCRTSSRASTNASAKKARTCALRI